MRSNDYGYFWDKRNDSRVKSNLGYDYALGSTIVSGSNHDIIVLNGNDDRSMINMISHSTKSKDLSMVSIIGDSGIIELLSSQSLNIVSNKITISSAELTTLRSKGNVDVIRKKSRRIITDSGLKIMTNKDKDST